MLPTAARPWGGGLGRGRLAGRPRRPGWEQAQANRLPDPTEKKSPAFEQNLVCPKANSQGHSLLQKGLICHGLERPFPHPHSLSLLGLE